MLYVFALLLLLVSCERNAGGTVVDNPPDMPQNAYVEGVIVHQGGESSDSGKVYVYSDENPYAPIDSFTFVEGKYALSLKVKDSLQIALNFVEAFDFASVEKGIKLYGGDTLHLNTELLPLYTGDILKAIDGEVGIYSGEDFSDLSIPYFYFQPQTNGANWVTYYIPESELELQLFIKGDSTAFKIDRQNDSLRLELLYGKLQKDSSASYDTLVSVWQEIAFLYGDAGALPVLNPVGEDSLALNFWNPQSLSLQKISLSVSSNVGQVDSVPADSIFDATGIISRDAEGNWWVLQKSMASDIRPGLFKLKNSSWAESLRGSAPVGFPNPNLSASKNTWNFRLLFQQNQDAWLAYQEQDAGLKILRTDDYTSAADSLVWNSVAPEVGMGANGYFSYELLPRDSSGVILVYRYGINGDSLAFVESFEGSAWSQKAPPLQIAEGYAMTAAYSPQGVLWVAHTHADSTLRVHRFDSVVDTGWVEMPRVMPSSRRDMRRGKFVFTPTGRPILTVTQLNPDQIHHFVYSDNAWSVFKDMSAEGVGNEWDSAVLGEYFWFTWVDTKQNNRIRWRRIAF